MLYEISKEVDARLKVKKVPLRVAFGPERTKSTALNERIVIEHDEGDTFEALMLVQPNLGKPSPSAAFKRWQAAIARIYARSPNAGAIQADHYRRAEAVLDRLLLALDYVVRVRKNAMRLVGGRFILPEDLSSSETWPGALYELRFAIDRGVIDTDWNGESAETVEIVAPEDTGLHLLKGTLQTA